jgi:cytochrome c oxidase subunit 1
MGVHGIIMIAVAVTAILGAFGNYIVPIMIGAEDMAYPRLNALSFWIVPPAAIAILTSLFAEGWDTGWTAYPPLSEMNATGQVLFNLGFFTLGLSSIAGGINFLVTIITMRAPGMTWGRLPIFVWSVFGTALLSAFFTQFIGLAMLMLLLDRILGFSFFDPAQGGNPLLYQHVFWIYSHPAVYVMILPAFGAALEIISHFARKPLFAYRWAVAGILGIVGMSATVWAHHMFTAGITSPLQRVFLFSTELISIPTGLIFLSALGTIWEGRLWLKTPMLFALAVIANFLIGGLSGVFLADVPTDLHLHDTYFVVGHFHYTIVGGGIFGLFAAIYYWFPKITGRQFSERLAKIHFWWMFFGFNTTFLPMMWAGLNGMNRRVADYLPQLGGINMWISISAFLLGTSFFVFVYNMVRSWIRGTQAEGNPWKARTLEWQTSSPPPLENFEHEPVITGHPYDYGVSGSVHVSWEAGTHAGD